MHYEIEQITGETNGSRPLQEFNNREGMTLEEIRKALGAAAERASSFTVIEP